MSTKTELERLVAVETKIDILIKSNEELIKEFRAMKEEQGGFVHFTRYEKDMLALETKLEQSKRRSTVYTWITSTLAALLGVIMTILIQSYLGK